MSDAIRVGLVSLTAAQLAYLRNTTALDYTAQRALPSANMVGLILLFRLKEPAIAVPVAVYRIGILLTLTREFTRGSFASLVGGGPTASING